MDLGNEYDRSLLPPFGNLTMLNMFVKFNKKNVNFVTQVISTAILASLKCTAAGDRLRAS
jgi:hypothetical protein